MASTSGCHIDLVVKLGGSAITNKESLETVHRAELAEAAQLVNTCWKKGLTCVVVHGAGSFGHQHANIYSVNKGWNGLNRDGQTNVRRGFCLTRQSVLKLHRMVVDALLKENLPAVGQSACGTWSMEDGKLTCHNVAGVESLLKERFIPVLHGDCILDSQHGCGILSGDIIIKTLCRECTVDRVVFLTNVDGIYNMPPDLPEAKLLDRIYVYKDGTISSLVSTSKSQNDITGGMKLKLHTATDIVRHSRGRTRVFVCRIGSNSASVACSDGFSDSFVDGTAILMHPPVVIVD